MHNGFIAPDYYLRFAFDAMRKKLNLKLKYIADHTPYSMNSFILERLTEEIEKEVARLID